MFPKICVVIPIYNGRDYLPDCLNSLKEQTFLPEVVILVDNASTDKSLEFIRHFATPSPELKIQIITNKVNKGFVGACNQGMEEAIKNGADYIFLLNQDTVCERNCLEELFSASQKQFSNSHELENNNLEQNRIFAIQPLILCWPRKDLIQTSGDRIHFLGFGHSGDYKRPKSIINYQLSMINITYASGAAMFINVKALKEVGLFDKDLFVYHEDLDLCLRARFLGYRIILAPEAIVYHKYTEGIPRHRWYWSERNRQLTLLKFYKLPTLILILPLWLAMEFGVLIYSLLTGWFHFKIKSYFSVLGQLPKTLKKRRQIQKSRKINDCQLAKILETKFDFAGLEHPLLKYLVNPFFGTAWKILRRFIFW